MSKTVSPKPRPRTAAEALEAALMAVAQVKVRVQMRDAQGFPFAELKDVEFYRNEVLTLMQAMIEEEVGHE